jgi:hypothetical protein
MNRSSVLPPDPSDHLHTHASAFASDQDSAWFRDHPGEDRYVREGFEHEWCRSGPHGACLSLLDPLLPAGWTVVVEVQELGPGVRSRRPLYTVANLEDGTGTGGGV